VVRARLRATGELSADGGADSTTYDDALAGAVKTFQDRHRLDADGTIDAATIAAMNVPAQDRVAQVRASLERARWVLPGLEGDFVLVNLPAFKAYLIRGGKVAWECRTVIGKEGRESPSFRDQLEHVIFNPTWTVPPTILAEDVLGAKGGGASAVAKKGLRIFDSEGKEVDPGSIDWGSATPENFRYTLRQDAGDDNALGRVKFMFPNPYNVYLHDTPHRELFAEEQRTFSSGCIRLQDPLGFAAQLLGDQGYDAAKIEETVASGKTKQVNLTKPLPILIVYWTVTVGTSGEVRYAEDVYGQDPPLVHALDAPETRTAQAEMTRVRG
jgi:murein L,D-transpeptidase YcbB/YkuD